MLKVYFTPAGKGASLLRDGQVQRLTDLTQLNFGDKIKTEVNESGNLNFDGAELRLAPSSTLTFSDQNNDAIYLSLEQGKVWVNTLLSEKQIVLRAGPIVAKPGVYAAEFELADNSGTVMVHDKEVDVGLVKSNSSLNANDYEKSFVNHMLIPFNRKLSVDQGKVDDTADDLGKLLYSKLIKEFQYDVIGDTDFDDDVWLKTNLAHDEDFVTKKNDDIKSQIRSRGLQVSSLDSNVYQFDKLVSNFADLLTFNSDRGKQRKLDQIFSNLEDAEYLILYGRVTEAKDRLNIFGQIFGDAYTSVDTGFQDSLSSKLLDEYRLLTAISSVDDLFQVKSKIVDLFVTKVDKSLPQDLQFINEYLYQAKLMAEDNTQLARQNLTKFSSLLTTFIQSKKNVLRNNAALLSQENIILDNLFIQYAQFYQDNYFALKHQVETAWLDILPNGEAKDEEIRNVSLSKVDFLKRAKDFFLQGYVSLDDVKAILRRLIGELNDLQSNNNLGIGGLVDLRLKDYGQFLLFINSVKPDDLRGGLIQDVYDKYVAAHNSDNVNIDQAVNEFTGQNSSTQQTADNTQNTDSQQLIDTQQVAPLTQQTIDQSQHSSPDVSLPTEQTSADTQFVDTQTTDQQAPVVETQADKISKILLGKKVKDLGIQYAYIEVAPSETGVYIFHGAILGDKIFDFYLDRASLQVTNITFTSGASTIDGPIDLATLAQTVSGN